jgi:hypothetical protein
VEYKPLLEEAEAVKKAQVSLKIKPYLAEFEEEVDENFVVVGNVSLEEVQAHEQEQEKQRIAAVKTELLRHRKRQEDLRRREMFAKNKLLALREGMKEELEAQNIKVMQQKLRAVHDAQVRTTIYPIVSLFYCWMVTLLRSLSLSSDAIDLSHICDSLSSCLPV